MNAPSKAFPKECRLLNRRGFLRLKKKGKKRVGHYLVLYYLLDENQKLGLTVSRHFGKAHERNRFKRQCREAFRLFRHELPSTIHLVLSPRHKAKGALTSCITHELLALCNSLQQKGPTTSEDEPLEIKE